MTAAPKPPRFRCWKCGALNSAYAPAERHGDTPGHGRIELLLTLAAARTAR